MSVKHQAVKQTTICRQVTNRRPYFNGRLTDERFISGDLHSEYHYDEFIV